MQQETSLRNLIIAMVAIGAIMLFWQIFFWGPEQEARNEMLAARQAANEQVEAANTAATEGAAEALPAEPVYEDVRIPFSGPAMDGSILLRGARVDTLNLRNYYETLEDREAENPEGEVTIFQPQGTGDGYYASLGWTNSEGAAITDAQTPWQLVEGEELTPETPIVIGYDTDGLSIRREVSIDENFMFTFTDTVTNTSGRERSVQPYGVLRQFGAPDDLANFYILHEGLVAATGGELHLEKYKKLEEGASFGRDSTEGGWIGLTSKYWLGALIPDQSQPFNVSYRTINRDSGQVLQARMDGAASLLAPGETITSVNRVFGGAKESSTLRAYEEELGISRFQDAIDWGSMFFWLTKPFFFLLSWINSIVGNFGISILILTVLVKAVFFPIQTKAYQSMAKMRELSEPMKRIRETVEDKQEQQRQLAELYQKSGVNPLAGCLPIFIQIPVFYGLYKTLFVTIEMRHEDFPLLPWIQDLSAPDPTALGNLFGLIPISNAALESVPLIGPMILTVGFLPIFYGITMWALQSLNPPPTDNTQKLIFGMMPIILTFVFSSFAVGLVIYWCWSNILSIAQQYVIMRRHGQETQVDKLIKRLFSKKGEASE